MCLAAVLEQDSAAVLFDSCAILYVSRFMTALIAYRRSSRGIDEGKMLRRCISEQFNDTCFGPRPAVSHRAATGISDPKRLQGAVGNLWSAYLAVVAT